MADDDPKDIPTEDWEGFKPALTLPHMSDADLKKFVLDFLGNAIFTDKHIAPHDQMSMLPMVFMPIALGALAKTEASSLEQIGCIWEFMSAAGPTAINGYPIFVSCRLMHKDDWVRAKEAIMREEERRANIEV